MKPIIRFISLAPIIAAIALLSLLVSPSDLVAQKNQFRCKHGIIDGDDGTGKCSLCRTSYGDKTEDQECQEAKSVLLSAPTSPWRGNYRSVDEMLCGAAKTFATTYGWKSQDDLRRERGEAKRTADSDAAKGITQQFNQALQNSPLRQLELKSLSDQRVLLTVDAAALKQRADDMESDARKVNEEANEARRNGALQTAIALDSAATKTRLMAGAARNLATLASSLQQSEKSRIEGETRKAESDRYWAAQRAKDDADHEARMKAISEPRPNTSLHEVGKPLGVIKSPRDLRTLGEATTGKKFPRTLGIGGDDIEMAIDHQEAVDGLGNPVSDTINKKIWPKIEGNLDHPNAEPRRSDPSRGYPSGINPGSSGGGSRAPYNPPATLPRFAPPSASQPITDQDVNRDFETLKSGSGGRPAPRIPSVPMPPEPKPNPTPPPAASPDPTVLDTFKKWLGDLGKPAPSPLPAPTPPPKNQFEPRSK